jgi:hypothetical protein
LVGVLAAWDGVAVAAAIPFSAGKVVMGVGVVLDREVEEVIDAPAVGLISSGGGPPKAPVTGVRAGVPAGVPAGVSTDVSAGVSAAPVAVGGVCEMPD